MQTNTHVQRSLVKIKNKNESNNFLRNEYEPTIFGRVLIVNENE